MNVRYAKFFMEDLARLPQKVRERVTALTLDSAPLQQSIFDIPGCKPVYGHSALYRIKMGDYRVAFRFNDETATFLRVISRENIELPLKWLTQTRNKINPRAASQLMVFFSSALVIIFFFTGKLKPQTISQQIPISKSFTNVL